MKNGLFHLLMPTSLLIPLFFSLAIYASHLACVCVALRISSGSRSDSQVRSQSLAPCHNRSYNTGLTSTWSGRDLTFSPSHEWLDNSLESLKSRSVNLHPIQGNHHLIEITAICLSRGDVE